MSEFSAPREAPGSEGNVSARLAWLRQETFGPRGRAAFARAVGVSPSTYNYYEKGREPPADLLARAADATGASLDWLVAGRGVPFPSPLGDDRARMLSHPGQAIAARFAEAASGRGAAAARASLQDLVARVERAFPTPVSWSTHTVPPTPTCIPILGRTAAGILAPWEAYFDGEDDPRALEALIDRVAGRSGRARPGDIRVADHQDEAAEPADRTAMLIQLSEPTADGVAEFVDVPALGTRAAGSFALRVDGDSMAPRIRDGDVVVTRRDAPPEAGRTAVVKVRGRVGVTVKVWRAEGEAVHLVRINEAYEPLALSRSDVLGAWRVLWVVRL